MESVGATRADWDGVEGLLKVHYQDVWEQAVESHFSYLRETPFHEIEVRSFFLVSFHVGH